MIRFTRSERLLTGWSALAGGLLSVVMVGLYFVHSGTARFEADGETRELGPGGFLHAPAATHRKVSNAGDTECVVLVVGAKDGYVGRDGQLVDPADLERRKSFGSSNA